MTIPTTKPIFKDPPDEYDREYFKEVLRQVELYTQRINAAGPVQATTINLSQLPTSSVGLKAGDLWNSAGTVKIV